MIGQKKRELRDLRNVGKAFLKNLQLLEIGSVEKLAEQDPTALYHELERRTHSKQDPCVWDVFAAIIHEASTGEPTNWWDWTKRRKLLQKTGQVSHVV